MYVCIQICINLVTRYLYLYNIYTYTYIYIYIS